MSGVSELASRLIRLHTDGRDESSAVEVLAPRLEAAGFDVRRTAFARGRETLDAELLGDGPPLVMTGHLDTVPVPEERWEHAAFGGEIIDGQLHGRGSVDMKSGVAAMVVAAERVAARRTNRTALRLLFTAAEETGCLGAASHLETVGSATASALLVGEPTGGQVFVGHKGVLWLRIAATGRAAHASAPHLGDNAVVRLIDALTRLRGLDLGPAHPVLGAPSSSIGIISGGVQTNVVPATAHAMLDVRLVPGLTAQAAEAAVRARVGDEVDVDVVLSLPAVATREHEPFVDVVAGAVARHVGTASLAGASYFTDASVLAPALDDPPVVICGPGDPALAHGRDEHCAVEQIEQSVEVYTDVASSWTGQTS